LKHKYNFLRFSANFPVDIQKSLPFFSNCISLRLKVDIFFLNMWIFRGRGDHAQISPVPPPPLLCHWTVVIRIRLWLEGTWKLRGLNISELLRCLPLHFALSQDSGNIHRISNMGIPTKKTVYCTCHASSRHSVVWSWTLRKTRSWSEMHLHG